MSSEAYENGRNRALSEIQAKLDAAAARKKKLRNTDFNFDQDDDDELALANITNSDPDATLRRIMNQRRASNFKGTPHFTPADVRRMMNVRDQGESFNDVRALNRTIALAKIGVINAGEAMESIEELRAKAGFRKIRRSKVGNTMTAAELLEEEYRKYKNRRDPLEKMCFKKD